MPEAERSATGPSVDKGRTVWKTRITWLLRLVIGLAILFYIFTFIPFDGVLSAISGAQADFLALAFLVLVLERFTAALRTRILTGHLGMMGLSVWKLWEINTVATFYGMFLPGELAGGAVRWYKMSQPNRMRAEAAAAITFDRLVDTIVLLVLGMLFWLADPPPIANTAIAILFFGLLGGLLLALCLSLSRGAMALILRPLRFGANRRGFRMLYSMFEKVVTAVGRYRHLPAGEVAGILTLTLLRHLLSLVILFLFALALGMEVGFVNLGWVRSFMNVVTMIPISFSGLGIREGSLVLLLEPYGIPGTLAVALSFLTLIMHILMAAAGGLLEVKNVILGGRKKERLA